MLFRGRDGELYKSGFAPLRDDDRARSPFAVGVDGAASLYEQLAGFRRTLFAVGVGGALPMVALSILVARLLARPIRRLARAAERIGRGDLDEPVRRDVARRDRPRRRHAWSRCAQQLRARDERMQMMLAGIAHEVRNPLGGIELYAGLLRDELAGDAEKLAHVQRIERELGHLKIIVNDFLEYARRPKPERRRRATSPSCSPRCATSPSPPRSRATSRVAARRRAGARRRRRRPAAPRARQPGAQRGAGLRRRTASGEVTLGCARSDGEVRRHRARHRRAASTPSMLAKIWTPFYTTKQSGTGLGLAFVRDIARDHGARLAVDSAPGRGTTFTLALPGGQS